MDPQYKWQPVTDFYKEQQATQTVDPAAETQQKLQEIQEQAKKTSRVERKAPLLITIYGWYLICRVGFFLLLLLIIASLPQADFAKHLVASIERNLPYHSVREQQEQQREMLRRYGYNPDAAYNPDGTPNDDSPDARYDRLRKFAMVALFFLAGMTSVVAFMWWNRSWKIRWVAMFYAGAFLAKAAAGLLAGWASGVGSGLSPIQMSYLVVALAWNGFVFCYLAFWPGVEEWFKEW